MFQDHGFRIPLGRFGLYQLGNHEIITLNFDPFGPLGPRALRLDPRVPEPRFSDWL